MPIPSTEVIDWNDSQYLRKEDTFDIWRKKTNGLKNASPTKVWGTFFGAINSSGLLDSTATNRLINSSYNVSSIQKIATGRYKINFTNPLPNKRYSVIGTGGYFNNIDANAGGQSIVYPYVLHENYAYINVVDPTGNNFQDSSLINFSIFSTDDSNPIASTASASIYIKLTQTDGDSWRLYGKFASSQNLTGYTCKVTSEIRGNTTSNSFTITDTSYKQILSNTSTSNGSSNTGQNNYDLYQLKIYNSADVEVYSFPINYNYNTGANINGGTSGTFTITSVGENTGNYTLISNSNPSGSTAEVEFRILF